MPQTGEPTVDAFLERYRCSRSAALIYRRVLTRLLTFLRTTGSWDGVSPIRWSRLLPLRSPGSGELFVHPMETPLVRRFREWLPSAAAPSDVKRARGVLMAFCRYLAGTGDLAKARRWLKVPLSGNPDVDTFLQGYGGNPVTLHAHATHLGWLLEFAANAGLGAPEEIDWAHFIPCMTRSGESAGRRPLDTVFCDDFLAAVRTGGATPVSVWVAQRTLRLFGRYLVDAGVLGADPTEGVVCPPCPISRRSGFVIEPEEASALLRTARDPRLSKFPERDYALLRFLLTSAARPGEVKRFALTPEPEWGMVEGKRGRREVPVPAPVRAAIERHQDHPRRSHLPPAPAFLDDRDLPFTADAIASWLRRLCKRAGIRSLAPYAFRHTCATRWARKGVPLAVIAALMGHATSRTTLQYIHVDRNPTRHSLVDEWVLGVMKDPS